ncbi:Cell division topological specificity factor [uncultured Thiomicrorhabdus sp.]
MALLDYLLGQRKQKSANKAKDRLQILLAHERARTKHRTICRRCVTKFCK